jgi:hypothetical protein
MAYDIGTRKMTRKNFAMSGLLIPAKQEKALFAKIDDVRFDVRNVGSKVSGGLLALSAALGMLGLASIYRTAQASSKYENMR